MTIEQQAKNLLRHHSKDYDEPSCNIHCSGALAAIEAALSKQPVSEAVPVDWSLSEFIHDDYSTPIGTDVPRVVWGAECPDETEGWSPLFGYPPAAITDGRVVDNEDTALLNWLEANEASLVMHAETWNVDDPECEYSIWWNVVKGGKSISGHPLGDVRETIKAAIAAAPGSAEGE